MGGRRDVSVYLRYGSGCAVRRIGVVVLQTYSRLSVPAVIASPSGAYAIVEDGEMHETQYSIGMWADETFGECTSLQAALTRARQEFDELEDAVTFDKPIAEVAKEIADVVITLERMACYLGVDLRREIDAKMKINRARKWKRDGTGHGQHIKA